MFIGSSLPQLQSAVYEFSDQITQHIADYAAMPLEDNQLIPATPDNQNEIQPKNILLFQLFYKELKIAHKELIKKNVFPVINDYFQQYAFSGPYSDFTHISNFAFDADNLTKHLTPKQRKDINDRIKEYHITAENVCNFISTVNMKGGIEKISITSKHIVDRQTVLSLLAYLKKGSNFNLSQALSFFLLWSGLNDLVFRQKYFRTFYCAGQKPTTQAVDIISSAQVDVYPTNIFEEGGVSLQTFFRMTDKQFCVLKKRMKTKPDSEKYFYAIPVPLGGTITWCPLLSIFEKIAPKYLFRPIGIAENSLCGHQFKMMLFPSYSMLDEFYKITYGKNREIMVPYIGEPEQETILNSRACDERMVRFGMVAAPTPQTFGNIPCINFGYTYYDLCKLSIDCSVPKKAREAIYYLTEELLKKSKNPFAQEVREQLLFQELYQPGEKFESIFSIGKVNWTPHLIKEVLSDMKVNSVLWKERFNLSLEDVQETLEKFKID